VLWILPVVFTGLLVVRAMQGEARLLSWDQNAQVVFFYIIVWILPIALTLQSLRQQDFRVTTEGVALPRRPLQHVLRRKRVVGFEEIERLRVLVRSDGNWSAQLWLRGGGMAVISSYEGLPRGAVDMIIAEVRSRSGGDRTRVVEVPLFSEQNLWSDPGTGSREPRR